MIHNQAIDEKVLAYYDDVDEDIQTSYVSPSYKEEILFAKIGQENLLATSKDFERLMQHSIVTRDNITRMEELNATRDISSKITKVEVERINKNLGTVEKILEQGEVDLKVYKDLINKLPRQVSRQDILEKALADGKNFRGREYSFKELSRLSRDLEKYKTSHMDYMKARIENKQADREGMPSPNTTKTWIWSQLERTRHEGMDGETVRFGEKFTVVNEVTGDTDYLRFPNDIENDNHNCSNICNCGCSYEIN